MPHNYLIARSYYTFLSLCIYPAFSRFAAAAVDLQIIFQPLVVRNPELICIACFSKQFLFLVTGLKVSNISYKSNGEREYFGNRNGAE